MHVTGMTVGGIPPFTEPVEFEFDERVNVFIGPNSSGKSTVLRLLRESRREDRKYFSYHHIPTSFVEASVSDDWPKTVCPSQDVVPEWNKLPYIEISATRVGLPTVELDDPDSLYFPAKRNEGTLESILGHGNPLGIFDGSCVERVVDLMIDETRSTVRASSRVNLDKAMDISFRCAKDICSEIVKGSTALNLVVGGQDLYGDLFATPPEVRSGMAIDTIDCDPQGDSLPFHWLSSGVQGSLLWIRFLALKMLYHYKFADGWEKQPAILLIDEIENHLHPTWQRRVIPALLEHFPGLQIFATTHSPFVVAGLKAGQVHLLRRDADGVVKATTNNEAIEGWTADEILRVYMGVEHPTDEETAVAARDLRKLRDAGVRADAQEEEERQAEILRLRRIVDRVELSGPRVAENERFLANLDAILERHIKSQSLNQENG